MKILGIIPARFGSTRFPGKPLVDIDGKTMIQRVFEQAKSCTSLTDVIVATDDERIFNEVTRFGGKVAMTSTNHQSGTDRCAEVVTNLTENFNVVINIQGDEPFINPEQIKQLCNCFADSKTQIATLVKKISSSEDLFNENKVKAVIDKNNFALYFSRNPIPYFRCEPKENWLNKHNYFKHIGIYGYRREALLQFTSWPVAPIEDSEKLEQLRLLYHGVPIYMVETQHKPIGIDTLEDLEKARLLWQNQVD
ncbi:MAG: 3-deoxy-manno-octulosonate cytidylyltransferase [Flavobacteriales bacterium]|nr:3-deoxy-manno-octulosonate cytidylyltransferase [Flavobacteriales bacterium]